jgi:hypothetical protein
MAELVTALLAQRATRNNSALIDCLGLADLVRVTGRNGPFPPWQVMRALNSRTATDVSRRLRRLRIAGLIDADYEGRDGLLINRIGP